MKNVIKVVLLSSVIAFSTSCKKEDTITEETKTVTPEPTPNPTPTTLASKITGNYSGNGRYKTEVGGSYTNTSSIIINNHGTSGTSVAVTNSAGSFNFIMSLVSEDASYIYGNSRTQGYDLQYVKSSGRIILYYTWNSQGKRLEFDGTKQ